MRLVAKCISIRSAMAARALNANTSVERLRADDAKEKFVRDFVDACDKVMNLDRFDLA